MKFLKKNKDIVLSVIIIAGVMLSVGAVFYKVFKDPIFIEYPVLSSN